MKIIAHRGYWKSEGAAQNSLNAVKAAIKGGFHGLEVDVRMSKDKVLYLCHDPAFKGSVIHKTHSSVIDQLELSSGENIPRFEDFLKVVKEAPELILYLEIKSSRSSKYRRLITQKLIARLKSNNLIQNSIILCFDRRILKRVASIEPKLSRMVLFDNLDFDFFKLEHQKINAIGFYYKLILEHPELIAQSKEMGFEINAWTVNKPAKAEEVMKLPVTSITTDIPNEILKMVSRTTPI